ncbi:hypothetical protein DESC_730123 [Desulfosarcina cetonica]|nr:hypothetical protein DESC_730123 [Desulfosarcina cetonica]
MALALLSMGQVAANVLRQWRRPLACPAVDLIQGESAHERIHSNHLQSEIDRDRWRHHAPQQCGSGGHAQPDSR